MIFEVLAVSLYEISNKIDKTVEKNSGKCIYTA